MKLLFFDDYKLGVLRDEEVVDVSSVVEHADILPPQEVMERVIANFDSYKGKLEAASNGSGVPLSNVKVHAPLPRPHCVLCAFSNYRDRVDGSTTDIDFFYKGSQSVIGDGDTIEIPELPGATAFQPEPELGYVIGKPAKNVSEADAMNYVFGYVNFVDMSARGPGVQQRRTTFLHKGLHTWGPMGPYITTADEIPDPHNVQIKLWLNGELQQDYNTGQMNNKIPTQIAWLSKHQRLMPGDVISCGVYHKGLCNVNDGDKFELGGENLGILHLNVRSHNEPKLERWRPPGVQD